MGRIAGQVGSLIYVVWRSERLSEKEESLSSRRFVRLCDLRNVRQIAPLEGSQRILHEQRTRLLSAELALHNIICCLQPQRPRPIVVCVAGHDVNESFPNPA